MTLDPKAVEAAAKARQDHIQEGVWEALPPSIHQWDFELTDVAITAYIAAIEPKLREAVFDLLLATDMKCIYQQDGCLTDDVTVNKRRAALFALLGLEAE